MLENKLYNSRYDNNIYVHILGTLFMEVIIIIVQFNDPDLLNSKWSWHAAGVSSKMRSMWPQSSVCETDTESQWTVLFLLIYSNGSA